MEVALKVMQDMWQIPYICQFVKLFHGSLNIEPITPEELEQALLEPRTSILCGELISKLLLKKSSQRRDLAIGEGLNYERWLGMLTKNISSWYKIYLRNEKEGKSEKFSAAHRIVVHMFDELQGNPFLIPEGQTGGSMDHRGPSPQRTNISEGQRATRSATNSLPKSRKLRYSIDMYANSSEGDDEEHFRCLSELSEEQRVIVVYYLCLYKLETDEEMLHELNYVPMIQQRVEAIGRDQEKNSYYWFDNIDCRIYRESADLKFSLVAKSLEQVRELIDRLQSNKCYELAVKLSSMLDKMQFNEQERAKRMLAHIKKIHLLPDQRRSTPDYDIDDSDFSPVEDDLPKKRGPGRPRKIPLPERKPKVMPSTSGNQLILRGTLKRISAHNEVFHSFTGNWELSSKQPQEYRYLKTDSDSIDGIYKGYWMYFSKSVEELLDLRFNGAEVSGYGENMFGLFKVSGRWRSETNAEVMGERSLGQVELIRQYIKVELTEDSSCSEADNELYDAVKPPYRLEFEEKLYLEHMRMPLKDIHELKRNLKAQERRELKRLPFYKSEYLLA
mmetsp:Transcript_16906/g.30269  ORF Transcript_16906/g.30269 Transcript_16906/m.30269 type:complete len:559 (-) Transcript_16906:15854-17530(-)